VETERLYLAISKLLGSDSSNLTLSDTELDAISEHAHCVAAKRRPRCKLIDLRFRTVDGSCNNFFYPLNGAAETPFARILPALYEDGISDPVGLAQQKAGKPFSSPWPSPRLISWKIIQDLRPLGFGSITHMVMQWGQFLDHDLDIAPVFDEDACACDITPKCIPIEVYPGDTAFGVNTSNNGDCLPFSRSVPACSKHSIPRDQINDLTSYLDASNVYGSSKEIANALRLFKGGLLKQGGRQKTVKGNLPFQEDISDFGPLPFFFAGDVRANEQLGLTIMHTVWMREHNRIAKHLMHLNPCWNDERIYQETRKIVGAMHQVITFNEFLPILFGRNLKRYIPRYRGYNPFIDATIPASFAGAAYRFGHSLVRNRFDRLDRNYRRLSIGPLPLEQAFFNPIRYFESLGTDPILRGMTVVKANPVDEFLTTVLTSKLFVKPGETIGGDLASLNIQRGRDHGLPTYRKWEAFCKRQFPGIPVSFQSPDAQKKLTELYGVNGYRRGIDLWLGGLAENPLPSGIIGPTFGCILGISFSRLRDGDRFWYENPYVFTPRQRSTLRQVTLAKVICDNGDDIPRIQRSVFKAGRRRVRCSAIAGLRLNEWWDCRCYNRRRQLRY
jgi:peroxidase